MKRIIVAVWLTLLLLSIFGINSVFAQTWTPNSTSGFLLSDPITTKIGIGTPSPETKLHLHDGTFRITTSVSTAYLFQGFTNGAANSNIGIAMHASTNSSSPYLWLAMAGSAWGGPANTAVIASSRNSGNTRDLWIFADDDLVPVAPNILVQANTGNVGIGTTSPRQKLDVSTGDDATGSKILMYGQELNIIDRYTSSDYSAKVWGEWPGYGALHFGLNSSAGAPSTVVPTLTIRNNSGAGTIGNVGIGTTAPNTIFHIHGSSPNITLSGTATGSGVNLGRVIGRSSTYFADIGSINFEGDGSFGGGNYPSRITFYTNPGSVGPNPVERMRITSTGNVIIGSSSSPSSSYLLNVWGKVRANEVVVNTDGADFVFEEDYALRSIEDVEKFVKDNKHLPEIPSAKEMQEKGVGVSELQTKLLQKIEELTLYVIEQNKELMRLKNLERENKELKQRVTAVEHHLNIGGQK